MPNPLYDALFAPLARRDAAFLFLPDGSALSGKAFHLMCARVAGALAEAGLKPGDRIAVQVEKSASALALYGGAVMAGVVFLPLNTGYTPDELSYFLADSGAALLIADGANAAAQAPVADRCDARLMTLNADGTGSFAAAMARAPAVPAAADRDPADLATLLYTSGTTGRSKGAMLS
ncbi:MAG: AMP-binding protein, partial [Pararhodobacter sp.]|nr:AMP-binding protein [Pararhodobacter sp.]